MLQAPFLKAAICAVRKLHSLSQTCHQIADEFSLYCRFTAPEGLRDGADSISQDFATNIYRMKQLGFNAVRLPYRFSDFLYLNPLIVEHQCQVAPAVRGPPLLLVCQEMCLPLLSAMLVKQGQSQRRTSLGLQIPIYADFELPLSSGIYTKQRQPAQDC